MFSIFFFFKNKNGKQFSFVFKVRNTFGKQRKNSKIRTKNRKLVWIITRAISYFLPYLTIISFFRDFLEIFWYLIHSLKFLLYVVWRSSSSHFILRRFTMVTHTRHTLVSSVHPSDYLFRITFMVLHTLELLKLEPYAQTCSKPKHSWNLIAWIYFFILFISRVYS